MKVEIFLVIVLLVLVGAGLYLIYPLYFGEAQELIIKDGNLIIKYNQSNNIIEDFPEGMFLYEDIRYPDREISYSILDNCMETRANNARDAFEIVDSMSVVNFVEKEEGGQIIVRCDQTRGGFDIFKSNSYVAGEGGPSSVINTSKYHMILNGSVILYTDNKCDQPVVALHELFHALGFKHSSNKKSIMFNVSNCNQIITNEMITNLNGLYNDPNLPDLVFSDAGGSNLGKYLNLNIEVLNAGLKDSGDFKLKLFVNNKEISSYDLETIEPGNGRILKLEKLFVPSKINSVVFVIDEENDVNEIDEKNNKLEMVL